MWLRIVLLCSLGAAALAQNVKCGSGWTQHEGFCFLPVSTKQTWNNARTDCQSKHGDLVVIPDQATADVLLKMLSGISTYYWIGLQDLTTEDLFTWVDGRTTKDTGYKNFVKPEPNNVGNEDCVAIKPGTKTGEWNDDSCTKTKPYICGRDAGYVPKCDEAKGWRYYDGKCYRFFSDNQYWGDAEATCATFSKGHLAIVKSTGIQDFLDNLQLASTSSYWIGLSDENGGKYEWTDGSAHDKNDEPKRWASGEPASSFFDVCAYVDGSSKKWKTDTCAWDRHKFICQVPEGTCPVGWLKFGGNCYQVNSKVLKTWTDAKDFCTDQGTNLISINSAAENEFLNISLSSLSTDGIAQVYIGISDIDKDGTFTWSDSGTAPSFTHWSTNNMPPKSNKKKDCGYIMTADFNNPSWLAGDCFMLSAYICKVAVGHNVKYVPLTQVSGSCDDGWDLFNKKCYKFVQKKATWNTAKKECPKLNAALSKIPNDQVQSFVSGRLYAVGLSIWIGLNDKTTEGTYKWVDDTALDPKQANWATGHPKSGNRDCVKMRAAITEHSLWETDTCSISYFYLCDKKAKDAVQPSKPVPTISYLERCGNGWEYDKKSGKCFIFRPSAYESWYYARSICRTEGGDLMSLQGNDDFNYAKTRLAEYGQGASWIGCNDLGIEGGWVWSDKKAFSFLNWAPNEPNNVASYYSNGEHCCEMYNKGGDWNDNDCTWYKGYSCNRDEFIFKFFISFTEKKLTPTDSGTTITDDLTIKNMWPRDCAERCVYEKSFNCLSFDYNRDQRTCFLRKINKGSAGMQLLPTFDQQHFDYYERDSAVPHPPTPTELPATMGCPSGWALYGDTCFLIGTTDNDVAGAEAECKKDNAMLASIRDRNTNNFLVALIFDKNMRNSNFWIGLGDPTQEALFEWSNGDPVTFTNWNRHEPNNVEHNHLNAPKIGEDCVELYSDSGYWNDNACSEHKMKHVCSKPASAGNPQPSNSKCPKDWIQWNNRCFQFNKKTTDWKDAGSVKCKATSGAQLVVIDSREKLAYLSSQLGLQEKDEYYIALSDSTTPGLYEWMDGSPVKFTNWDERQPDDQTGHCVTMNSGVDAGYWRDRDCTKKYNYICEKALSGDPAITPPSIPDPTKPSDTDCATGWTGYGSRCFKAFMFEQYWDKLSWDEANRVCTSFGGALGSFHHPDEEAYLVKQFRINATDKFWIGLNDQRYNGGYFWSDGTVVQYTNWAENEPSDYWGYEECVQTDMVGGNWTDYYCWARRNFICSIAKGKTPVTTPAPTPATGDDCPGNPGWVYLDGYCYHFRQYYWDDWASARDSCRAEGGHLVSIHSEDEQNFILNQVSDGEYWIGLKANITHPDEFRWSDHTYLDYSNWEGVQDTKNGDHLCVHMVTTPPESKGKWKIFNCGKYGSYICKKNLNGPEPTHKPTPPPQGGCAPGWNQYSDKRCYKKMGSGKAGDPKLNWQNARTKCLGSSGHIVSIHSYDVQNELTADMIDANDDLWVGLSTMTSPQMFLWTDNTPFDYWNFAYEEGYLWSKNTSIPYCACMQKEDGESGKWHDDLCDVLHGYVCKKDPETRYEAKPPTRPDCKDMPGKGYVQFGKVCLKIYSDKKRTFEEAKTKCAADGAAVTVASVLTGYEEAMLETLIVYDDKIDDSVWIGMYKDMSTSLLGWIDGWPQHYSHWGYDHPKGLSCVALSKESYYFYYSGEWVNVNCTETFYTACKYNKEKPPTTKPPVDGSCEEGWTPYGESCYMVGTDRYELATYKDAYYDCSKIYGDSHIVTIGSKEENSFVTNLVKNKFTAYWILIGLERSSTGGWEWTDDTPVAYTNWGSERADEFNCVEIRPESMGKWYDIGCDVSSHYVCEKPKVPTTKPEPVSSGLGGGVIAAIVIGAVVLVVLVLILVGYLVRSRQPMKAPVPEPGIPPTTGFDNVLYAPSIDDVKPKPSTMSDA